MGGATPTLIDGQGQWTNFTVESNTPVLDNNAVATTPTKEQVAKLKQLWKMSEAALRNSERQWLTGSSVVDEEYHLPVQEDDKSQLASM